ncbi:low-density lipoprotein receptor class A domain-containing protein 1 isoform X1 [Salvelinus sp. IW2-2015]|uniref:low-density lipoprotein receptor class A domain-containing protein 1 isoform X1 n=1 Tax=Salvelinus sp. IW2-2015 TaxID=2691554 RepID=UPI0038D3E96B
MTIHWGHLMKDLSLGCGLSPVCLSTDCCGECCRPSCRCCSRRAVCLSSIILTVGTVLAVIGVILTLVFGIPKSPPVNRVCRTADNATGFLCDDRVTCIPPSDLCNGVVTCPKGADEDTHLCSDLPNNLPDGLVFRCGNPQFWVFTDKKCNNFNDCGDCSDEIGPYAGCAPCGVYWWPCIPVDFQYCSCIPRCLCRDGRQHCYDWSDEYTCPKSLTC